MAIALPAGFEPSTAIRILSTGSLGWECASSQHESEVYVHSALGHEADRIAMRFRFVS